MDVIRNRAPELQNTQMCSISHNNQLYMLKCKECCPFEVEDWSIPLVREITKCGLQKRLCFLW